MIEFTDATGKLRPLRDYREALQAIGKVMCSGIATLPPELFMALPVCAEVLKSLIIVLEKSEPPEPTP